MPGTSIALKIMYDKIMEKVGTGYLESGRVVTNSSKPCPVSDYIILLAFDLFPGTVWRIQKSQILR